MKTIQTDVAVIGSGPGGYVAAVRAAQLGKQVICIEKSAIGGVCLNVGCIPLKAMISAAKNYHKINHLQEMGISVESKSIQLDMEKLQTWKQSVVNKLTGGVQTLIKGSGGSILQGEARLLSKNLIEVTSAGETVQVQAQSIVIATGSRPIENPAFLIENEYVHDSTGGLSFRSVPTRLVVIGGGYIGLELGMMWAKLGEKVSVLGDSLPISCFQGMILNLCLLYTKKPFPLE